MKRVEFKNRDITVVGNLYVPEEFHESKQFLTQPLLIVAGTAANTLWFSEELYRRAGAKDKTLHLVEGATHIAMYDICVPQAMEQLEPFFKRTL